MEVSLLEVAGQALLSIAEPERIFYLIFGVLIGLILGVIPGLSGLIGLSLLLPFTYSMEPLAALAMLIGLMSVTTTSDTIPAVLFGVPGTVGSAATVLDGHPMARRGEASRAFGAAFFASMMGGLFGAFLLGLSVPVLRPIMLMVGSPELLACCIFGLSLVAVLSGGNAFKGLAAVCLGLMLAMIGEDSQAGELRWTFDTIYLWDGIPIVPIALGLFAIPELADLAIRRSTVVREEFHDVKSTQREGVLDVIRHKWLVVRCASIGSLMGAVPGIGAAVIDWIAYGHAAKTEKGAQETFGTGDVRGVIASESSNNAKEGGSLVPTIAFGVPGSASMALLLGAFTVQGIVPGPDMLSKNLDVTYALVWSVAIANVIGAGICFGGAHILAKLALVRASLLVPVVLGIAFIGAFQGQKAWGDLYILVAAGIVGFVMKRLGWPRPPVILGFVLGALVERYMFIYVRRYDADWIFHPMVAILLLLSLYMVFAPTINGLVKRVRGRPEGRLQLGWFINASRWDVGFTAVVFALFAYGVTSAQSWAPSARLFPVVIGWIGVLAVTCLLVGMCIRRVGGEAVAAGLHMDTVEEFKGLDPSTVAIRAVIFFAWCLGYLALSAIIGMLPAMAIFVFGFLYWTGREGLQTSLLMTASVVTLSYGLFHWILIVPWPEALLGEWLPGLREIRAFRLF